MRIVLDSNVLVAALVFPGGKADKALNRVLQGVDVLVISSPIIHEVLDVLARKFDREREELARTAVFLSDLGSLVAPTHRVKVLADDPNNRRPGGTGSDHRHRRPSPVATGPA